MDHDHPYKELFTHPELIADLLLLAHADLAAELDLSSLDRRNGTYVSDDWRERENDVIWRVGWRGRNLYIYVLIEFQSTVDADMVVRMMTYHCCPVRKSGKWSEDWFLPRKDTIMG